MAIFFNASLTSSHIYPLQVENCDSNSRLVVYEDDNGKFWLERVKGSSRDHKAYSYVYRLSEKTIFFNSYSWLCREH